MSDQLKARLAAAEIKLQLIIEVRTQVSILMDQLSRYQDLETLIAEPDFPYLEAVPWTTPRLNAEQFIRALPLLIELQHIMAEAQQPQREHPARRKTNHG